MAGAERGIPLRAVGVADREVAHRAVDVGVRRVGIIDRLVVAGIREVGGRPLEDEALDVAAAGGPVAPDQSQDVPADDVGAVDARGVGARVVDGVARAAGAGDGADVQQPVGVRRPGDEVLAGRAGIADALPARDRLHAHGIGVVVGDARHRIDLADQVAVGRGIDPHAVSAVAGDGLSVGQQADVVALDRDVRGDERDARVAGPHQRERPEGRSVGAGRRTGVPWYPGNSRSRPAIPANDGAVEPSMVTVSVIAGSEVLPTRIVPATSKSMVSGPGCCVGRDDRLTE